MDDTTWWRAIIEIGYSSRKLERQLSSEKEMKKAFGKNAERVAKRITALRAFDTLGEVKAYDPLGRWHELSGDRMGQWSGNTSERHRIIVKPDFDGSEVSATDATQGTVLECNINYHEK